MAPPLFDSLLCSPNIRRRERFGSLEVIEPTGFKYVISLHADPVAFHIRNARLPCHDEIRREAKGEVPTALTS